jgi:hypothetical protein
MKFKVILAKDDSPSQINGPVSMSFFTKAQARDCAMSWTEAGTSYVAWWYDGSTWAQI